MRTKAATAADTVAGQRLRTFRINAGLSQTTVAEHLGITYQQIQKYEHGINRMGASRIAQLAELLGVQPADFFDANTTKPGEPTLLIETSQERRLIIAFRRLTPTQRAAVTSLLGSIKKEK